MPLKDILSEKAQKFIKDHEAHDPFSLALQADKYPDLPVRDLAEQIASKRKAKKKLPAWYACEGIIFPPKLSMEQCSSELTAKYKAGLVSGDRMADITGGSGVDTFYLSKSFRHADYVEVNPALAEITEHNLKALGADNVDCHTGDGLVFIENSETTYDCIYLDPARRSDAGRKVYALEDCTPDIVKEKDKLLEKSEKVLVKTAPLMDIDRAVDDLGCVSKVWVVSSENECKEVLYLLEKEADNEPEIIAVDIQPNGTVRELSFTRKGEKDISTNLSEPDAYLYEPNPAVMKAGAFKSVADKFGLGKLHQHSHLYTGPDFLPDFPGRKFELIGTCTVDRKALKSILPEGKANVVTRNFPQSAENIKKKLKLKDGGNTFVFATTLLDGKKALLVCRRVLGL
ncbi:hypothetical protein FUAX_06370 [Fulvitalea axinellae]|uniref:THUMP-like domain-containing protein n=1 Tax=Fulvitalea axinellae TaxID=1182444 RepID=A0AAU9D7N8_9BACT|nr:hypothetical protein FUAX_06370 [Fulvitalea axinellae]